MITVMMMITIMIFTTTVKEKSNCQNTTTKATVIKKNRIAGFCTQAIFKLLFYRQECSS